MINSIQVVESLNLQGTWLIDAARVRKGSGGRGRSWEGTTHHLVWGEHLSLLWAEWMPTKKLASPRRASYQGEGTTASKGSGGDLPLGNKAQQEADTHAREQDRKTPSSGGAPEQATGELSSALQYLDTAQGRWTDICGCTQKPQQPGRVSAQANSSDTGWGTYNPTQFWHYLVIVSDPTG